MTSAFPHPRRRFALAGLILFGALLTGCLPLIDNFREVAGEPPSDPGDPGDPGDPPADPPGDQGVVFTVPLDGATITAPTILTVSGEGVTRVRFSVDSTQIFDDATAPFAWTLSPDSFAKGFHDVAVVAVTGAGDVNRTIRINLAPAPSGAEQPPEVFQAVANLKPGHWYEIPNTHLESVTPKPPPEGSLRGIMNAWSGGAFDTKRDRLIVWGGGHGDYSGNEIYVFDLNTLRWSRVTDPSAFPPGDPFNINDKVVHPDGRPISRHTYNYLAYIPEPVDRLYVGGGAGIWRGGQYEDYNTYTFDFDGLEWRTRSRTPAANIGAICATAPDGRVWQLSQGNPLSIYDAQSDVWTKHFPFQNVIGWLGYTYTAEFDTQRKRFMIVGRNQTLYWNESDPGAAPVNMGTTGNKACEDGESRGLAFHPPTGKLVAWNGGASVYVLDPDTAVWTKVDTAGSVSPGPSTSNGVYGRFRYCPRKDLFVVVNSVEANVFVYRLAR